MNNKIKDYLGIAGIAALVILIFGGLQYVSAYSRSISSSASFAASGEGRVTAIPDTAEFSFGITTEGGNNVPALQTDNTSKTNAAIAYLKSQGVSSEDITTENYSIYPRYGSVSCPTSYTSVSPAAAAGGSVTAPAIAPMPVKCDSQTIIGYTISQTVRVKVHNDFSKLGDLISGVTSQGANNVSGLTFTVHDRTALENEARAKAVQEAKQKAKDFARSGGFHLGRIISVQENSSQPPMYYAKLEADGRGGAASAPAPAIEPGSQEIVSNVTISYEIR